MTRVLLVEDTADILSVLKMELEWMGYQVDASTEAKAALVIARRAPPDVIVSDLSMPEMDGFQFIRRIRKISGLASVPAIALTGSTLDKDIRQAIASGFTTHMTKPIDAADLHKRISQLTARWVARKAS